MDLELTGRVAFVTGGSRGIGAATARLLGREGARVALSYCSDRAPAEAVADDIRRHGGEVCVTRLDLHAPESIQNAAAEVISRWGGIDILVNNAVDWVSIPLGPFEQAPASRWQPLLRANIEGAFVAAQSVVPSMRAGHWGRIVNVSSVAAVDGMPGFAWYGAAKAALHGLTQTLAKELGPDGVLVNTVMVGATLTDRVARLPAARLERLRRTLPTRRLPSPDDVAATIVFLSSAANRAITGEIVRSSGGRR
jgi:3-oxoacyl-[acyl-carrier protein] reductase